MTFTATVDTSKSPATLTVVSDFRKISGTVTSQGQTATYTGVWPLSIADSASHVWTLKSDDGATAVYTY